MLIARVKIGGRLMLSVIMAILMGIKGNPTTRCLDIQEKLLNFMESGHINVDQMQKRYAFTIMQYGLIMVYDRGIWP
jgi:hypothetical protein